MVAEKTQLSVGQVATIAAIILTTGCVIFYLLSTTESLLFVVVVTLIFIKFKTDQVAALKKTQQQGEQK